MALKIDPHNGSVLFNIGNAFEKQQKFEKAKWYYSQALANKPGLEKAKKALARIAPKAGKKPA